MERNWFGLSFCLDVLSCVLLGVVYWTCNQKIIMNLLIRWLCWLGGARMYYYYYYIFSIGVKLKSNESSFLCCCTTNNSNKWEEEKVVMITRSELIECAVGEKWTAVVLNTQQYPWAYIVVWGHLGMIFESNVSSDIKNNFFLLCLFVRSEWSWIIDPMP